MRGRWHLAVLAFLLLLTSPAVSAEQTAQELIPNGSLLSPASPGLQTALKKEVPRVSFQAAAFEAVLDALSQSSGANIFVDWAAIEAAGVERGSFITLQLKSVPLTDVLKLVLHEASGGRVRLSFLARSSVIFISTADKISSLVAVKSYDISDFIEQHDVVPGNPVVFLQSELRLLRAERDVLVGAAAIDVPRLATVNEQIDQTTHRLVTALQVPVWQGQEQAGREREAEGLMKLIQETIDRPAWVDNGGTTATMQHLNGKLIISASIDMHNDIASLLALLREKPQRPANQPNAPAVP